MVRAVERLSAAQVAELSKPGHHADGAGLYLQIGPTGSKSWVFRFRRSGRLRDMGLGPVHTVSLEQARKKALAARAKLLDGVDPISAKQAQVQRNRMRSSAPD